LELSDESVQHSVFTAIRSDMCSIATVISTNNGLQPTATAVYCIMLYSLYSLQQMQFIALCSIPFTACSNFSIFHYAVFPHSFYCHSQINDNIVSFENSTVVFAVSLLGRFGGTTT
jgi:hypothetical protein